jgi:hypothetical protein
MIFDLVLVTFMYSTAQKFPQNSKLAKLTFCAPKIRRIFERILGQQKSKIFASTAQK